MFVLIPAVLIYASLKAENKIINLLIVIGGVCGVLVSAITAVFSYMHRIPEYNFFSNFVYYVLRIYGLPMVLLFLVHIVCTKDDRLVRIKAFFPLVASFYAIYMPYIIVSSGNSAYAFFSLFIKPVLVLSMIFLCSRLVFNMYDGFAKKFIGKMIVNGILFIATVSFPAVLETMWLLHILIPVYYAAAVLYGAGALFLFFRESRNGNVYFF